MLVLVLVVLRVVLLLSDLRSAKAFSFHNRSSPNFAYTGLVTTDKIIRNRTVTDFKLSPD